MLLLVLCLSSVCLVAWGALRVWGGRPQAGLDGAARGSDEVGSDGESGAADQWPGWFSAAATPSQVPSGAGAEAQAHDVQNRAPAIVDPPQPPEPTTSSNSLSARSQAELVELIGLTRDRWVKADAVDELAARHARDSASVISSLLRDSDREVRCAAAEALAELGAEDQVASLASATAAESDRVVRSVMKSALVELQGR